MHGDEATASLAILDIFNFLLSSDEIFSLEIESILKNCTLYFIPILNPDGAKKFERRNHQEIDINRDAISLQTPEGRILKSVQEMIKPDWGFNLHDQMSNYSVGRTGKVASIAVLAPAYNYEKEINHVRERALKLCVDINSTLKKFWPGHVARYDDEFEPCAFGDNMQSWGVSTILIESGGYYNDPEKQEVRKMNFIALLNSFFSIANDSFINHKIDNYFSIPENDKLFFHLLIKNCKIIKDSISFTADIGINYNDKYDSTRKNYIQEFSVADLGDLRIYSSFDTIDAKGNILNFGKIYPKKVKRFKELKKINYKALLKEGCTTIIYKGKYFKEEELNRTLNLMISTNENPLREPKKILEHSTNFYLTDENGSIRSVICNGKILIKDGAFVIDD